MAVTIIPFERYSQIIHAYCTKKWEKLALIWISEDVL